jgi:hypothetical protein
MFGVGLLIRQNQCPDAEKCVMHRSGIEERGAADPVPAQTASEVRPSKCAEWKRQSGYHR